MKWNQLLRKEFTEIIKSKKILIPIIAVLFVPILYAGMFLWAFWDPYKQLDDLPVAVVNLDKGAVFDGKPIEVGKGLVDNLKDNTSFKWEFVSEKEAKKGMEGRKYYMLVRIPDDFSSNATTLLKDDPKPLNLEYIPNESLNFLSSQIGGTAIEKIKGEVASTLTKTYAEKMFDSIQDVSKGLADGAEGANKLHDGSSELHDGSSKVTDGLHTLQGKSGEMKDGVGKLADGSEKVTDGLYTLQGKSGEMTIGINKLLDGSGQVTAGSSKVTNGLNMLNSKTGEMQIGINELLKGTGQLYGGSSEVNSGLNVLVNKSGELQKGIGNLSDGSVQLYGGLKELEGKSIELNNGLKSASVGTNKLQKGTGELSSGLEKLDGAKDQLEEGAQKIQQGLQDLNNQVQSVVTSQANEQKSSNTTQQVNVEINKTVASVEQLKESSLSNAESANETTKDVAALKEQIASLPQEYQDKLEPFIANVKKSTDTVQKKSTEFVGTTNTVNKNVSQLKSVMNEGREGAQIKVSTAGNLNGLVAGIEKLATEQNKFLVNFQGFGQGLGVAKLGANNVAEGSKELNVGVSQLAENGPKLVSGVNELKNGAGKLSGGLGELSSGSNQLITGVNQLADGSGKVTSGLGKLNGGLGELSSGANQMVGGINQLAGGSSQVTEGSGQVTTGLGTLSGGTGQLVDGVNKLANGSGQVTTGLSTLSTGSTQLIDGVNKLADGSGKVTDGLVKVNDGSGELAEKLGEGAEKTGEVKGTDKTYDMFASPVKVKTEKMAEVPNYGTGFTPYFLSLGLFVGALLLSIVYPLRDTVGVPKSGFSWFISKFGVLLSVGVIQAIVADIILLFGLGVEVQSIPYFILFSIVTSLAFIALIQCLVTAFGDAGRFIAIITLIIQLTTSAGTFPLELIPKFLQPFNAWLPMTYSVSGLKAVVSSGDFNFMWQNVGVLMIFIVVLSLGTIASLTWMHKRQFRNIAENQSIEA
ncbi:YhgE/Pip domain-containing protein [Bacillus mobilis]|uniref:Phage infection protein n=2 Tax=Bacillus cereus group TaxID=86661 RepID=A0A1C4AI62_BACCE|nr:MULTISPECIES: YhgE/Pip domain-containing protein [Bacillus cereus group]MCC2463621.1 YhgE/Pip domain-containing protein [Bacillus mobilis]MCU5433077.1 YhgE/Pip domain-containing protein [Bacillus mobilis]MCU5593269.1 YhgE/Pip domain-containing protein [Bacillus mobilis]MCU5736014.1 YhgE/Pip domain-containing protein [Bacillus mobilis]MCU9560932.1 YhgE/Pip domain-containing protein [Bacillus mobilis]